MVNRQASKTKKIRDIFQIQNLDQDVRAEMSYYQYIKIFTFYLKLVAPLQKLLVHKIHYPAGISGPVGKAERKI